MLHEAKTSQPRARENPHGAETVHSISRSLRRVIQPITLIYIYIYILLRYTFVITKLFYKIVISFPIFTILFFSFHSDNFIFIVLFFFVLILNLIYKKKKTKILFFILFPSCFEN